MEIGVDIELDEDGFLRRACASCNREFKWLPSDTSPPTPDGLYGCPYCRSRSDDYLTDQQRDYLLAVGTQRAFEEAGFSRASEPSPPPPAALNDMTHVVPKCHPREPVKVYDEWIGKQPVYCIVCGVPA